jgi:threonine dehydrogenase-like Zn-dependent dehydrogenase
MVLQEGFTLGLLDVEDPHPSDGEVIVRVRAAGICGSELDGVRSQSPFRVPPLIMGHEFAGELPDGRLVAVNPLLACGRCRGCLGGRPNICASRRLLGIQLAGGFAEYVSAPLANCHVLPEGTTAVQGSLVEPFANAVHAYNLAIASAHGQMLDVGVIGAGAIGLSLATLLTQSNTARVAITDLDEGRLREAEQLGVDRSGPELSGQFDVIFDAVGSESTRRASVESLVPGGTAVWVGLHSPDAHLAGQPFVRDEKRVLGCFGYTSDEFAAAANVVGKVRPTWTATHSLEDGPEVFAELLRSTGSAARTVLTSA